MDNIYTAKELAQHLKVDYRTVLREISRGNLIAHKIGRMFIVTGENLEKYLTNSNLQPLRISVAIVINQDKVLLVKRKFKEGKLNWQYPAGRVRFKEKPSTRAEIECLEETSIHCRAIKRLGRRIHPDTNVIIQYWLCEYIEGKIYNVDTSENADVKWVGLVEPEKLFTSNYYHPVRKYLREVYEKNTR
ncbi:NUDIX domain-containing protein [Candidatus Nomurabacteria bacterium]|uniref:NUDIX domain-containing protein n=1 Tax=Candidatus Dojkabacteria bacterium TaxID=2099670 RepID=A0A955I0M1_9BACT|nr:NUDIX domain-containing protein [Candidatus Dojkabacteria bacterium]MCB9790022.1 NUDIX domain-containing protein [Candidatus Nomurabacteria bacterium]MCB9803391.1 NUDIX domain-containing protein [Candidatus Nomurabacteria bacterium]